MFSEYRYRIEVWNGRYFANSSFRYIEWNVTIRNLSDTSVFVKHNTYHTITQIERNSFQRTFMGAFPSCFSG